MAYNHLAVPLADGATPIGGLASAPDPYGVIWFDPLEEFAGAGPAQPWHLVPHLAFTVADLDAALLGRKLLSGPFHTPQGQRAAFVEENAVPVKLVEMAGAGVAG